MAAQGLGESGRDNNSYGDSYTDGYDYTNDGYDYTYVRLIVG
jgi:hypothetical protein